MRINPTQLVTVLRELQRRLGDSALPTIRIRLNDERFAWRSLPPRSACSMPAISVGQDEDWRFATNGPEGLHAHVFRSQGVVDFHLDAINACADVAAHAAADTHAFSGAMMGAALGAALGQALGGLGWGLALGALGGTLIGANVPKRARRIYTFERLFFGGGYPLPRLA